MPIPSWLSTRRISLAAATTGTKVLNFVIQNPQNPAWPAQAVAASVSMFYAGAGQAMSQCTVASNVFKPAACCTSPTPAACTVATTLSACIGASGNLASGTGSAATTAQVVAAINASQPVGASLSYTGGVNGYCAIYGYTIPSTTAWIWYIADPVNGYSLMNSSIFPSQYFGGATWYFTVYTES